MSVADKLQTVAENEIKVYNSGKLATLDASKYMNASVKGTVVAADDVSPTEHHLSVKLNSKNLIPYPYTAGTYIETNGIRFTVNSDGSITANGTATGQANFMVGFRNMQFEAGNYTLSGCPTGATWSTYTLGIVWDNENVSSIYDMGSGKTFTYTEDMVFRSLAISIFTGATVSNLTFYPQLELGSTATSYTPYITDFSGIEVSRYGKNIYKSQWLSNNSYAGVTAKRNSDGSFTLSGTATGLSLFIIDENKLSLHTGKYVVSHTGTENIQLFIFITDSTGTQRYYTGYKSLVCEIKDGDVINNIQVRVNNGITVNETIYLQFELGTIATGYEPYIEPVTATANADGMVEGLTSLTPSMTLVTDTDGIDINCQYYRDVDKYIDNLVMNVELTGGE